VLIERRDNHDARRIGAGQVAHHLETIHPRHLEVQEHQIRGQCMNAVKRLFPVLRLTDHLDGCHFLKLFAQDPPCDGFIVNQQRLQVAGCHRFLLQSVSRC
jgi:hypothetical protein